MKLEFHKPVFHAGPNVTVRRGDKYGDLRPYDMLEIGDIGQCMIERVTYIPFHSITDDDLKNEHDPSCRTKDGLLAEMQRCYPGFQENELVTLIQFWVGSEQLAVMG